MNKTIFAVFASLLLMACQPQIRPGIVPNYEVKMTQDQAPNPKLIVIGEIEPIYFLPMKSPFPARIDTGAETSSIDVSNIKHFERDGEKWVSFYLTNAQSGEKHFFEKKIEKKGAIKRMGVSEKRTFVEMDIKFGNETFSARFSLADRSKFEYQALIGRNILTGRAIIDTSLANTLH